MKKTRRILIVRTDRLGDVVLSTPVIENIRYWAPESYIAFMTRPYTRDVVADNPYLDEVLVYDKYGRHRGIAASMRFVREIRKKNFDLALLLHPTNRVNTITWLAHIPRRIGWDKKCGFLLTDKLLYIKKKDEKHERDYTLDILSMAGIPIRTRRPTLVIPEEVMFKMKQRLLSYGFLHGYIVIHPGASSRSKRWSAKKFKNLAAWITTELNIPVIIVGGREEQKLGFSIVGKNNQKIKDLTGVLSVKELAALFKEAITVVSNDSGPVHVASALGTPVIAIFGRKMPGLGPERWGPVGERDIVLQHDAGCLKCLADDCKNNFACLKALSVKEVASAILSLHKNNGSEAAGKNS